MSQVVTKRKRSVSPSDSKKKYTQGQKEEGAEEKEAEGEDIQSLIFRSSIISDRGSKFLGLYTLSTAPSEGKTLQSHGEISSADHKILGYRRESNQQAITGATKFTVGHDDDGEKYAGKKISRMLEVLGATGSCVVARWYGGVLLGPVRFEYIENCAREAVQKGVRALEEEIIRKREGERERVEREDFLVSLRRRDESIDVLRKLAAEKEMEVRSVKGEGEDARIPSSSSVLSSSLPTIDYESMAIDRLRALDKARDATLSFLLKRIDKAETELAQLNLHNKDSEVASNELESETEIQSHLSKENNEVDHSNGVDGKPTTRRSQSPRISLKDNG